jgi:parallel beta-helix repeat protein
MYGIYSYSAYPTIINNIISENKKSGIYCSFSSGTITNNTIIDNVENGIFCSSSSPKITNNIIGSSTQYGIRENDASSDPPTNYNCFWNNALGNYYDEGSTVRTVAWLNTTAGFAGNVALDPQFIDFEAGNYHLQVASLCIDAGSNTAPAIPVLDKDGKNRIIRIVDMGAYEFQGGLRIEDIAYQEIGAVNITTDGTLSLYLRGYDWDGSLIGDVAGTWTVKGGIGTISSSYGTSTVFDPRKVGVGSITVICGTLTDVTGLITVNYGSPATFYLLPARLPLMTKSHLLVSPKMLMVTHGMLPQYFQKMTQWEQ